MPDDLHRIPAVESQPTVTGSPLITGNRVIALHALLDRAAVPGGSLEERLGILVGSYELLCCERSEQGKLADRDKLLAALDEDRDVLLMALADEALDRGEEGEAKGWRWLADGHRWPVRDVTGWRWYRSSGGSRKYESDFLPMDLAEVCDITNPTGSFPSPRLALEAVVEVIASGRWPVKE